VVVEELQQRVQREALDDAGAGRPDRGRHRDQVVLAEARGEPGRAQEPSQRDVAGPRVVLEPTAEPVEPCDVGQEPQVARVEQVAWLRHDAARVAGVLEVAALAAQRPRHVGLLGLDVEDVEQAGHVRVGRLVVDDEAGVDRQPATVTVRVHAVGGRGHHAGRGPGARDRDGVGVPAQPRLALEQVHLVVAVQQPAGRQARDARPDDGDPHGRPPRTASWSPVRSGRGRCGLAARRHGGRGRAARRGSPTRVPAPAGCAVPTSIRAGDPPPQVLRHRLDAPRGSAPAPHAADGPHLVSDVGADPVRGEP
jgi:hypothetical protein